MNNRTILTQPAVRYEVEFASNADGETFLTVTPIINAKELKPRMLSCSHIDAISLNPYRNAWDVQIGSKIYTYHCTLLEVARRLHCVPASTKISYTEVG